MNKISIFMLIICLLLCSCERKSSTSNRGINKPVPKPFENPIDTVKRYIKALNNNDYIGLNNCHHPQSKLKEDSGEYEKLKDELSAIKVTKYEIIQSAIAASGTRAQVRLNWELVYTDPKTQQVQTFSDSGRVIELEKLGKKWLISPHNNGRMFMTSPTITKNIVDEKE